MEVIRFKTEERSRRYIYERGKVCKVEETEKKNIIVAVSSSSSINTYAADREKKILS